MLILYVPHCPMYDYRMLSDIELRQHRTLIIRSDRLLHLPLTNPERPLLAQSRRSYKLIRPPFNIYARIIFLFIRIKEMTLIPIDRKQTILEDAKERILKNHTLEQIAKSHGITKRTQNTWLMSLGDEYQELRQYCIDNMPY